MDPRFLRTFVTVVRLESFSAAARALGYTQSAVSQHIAVLGDRNDRNELPPVRMVEPREPRAARPERARKEPTISS